MADETQERRDGETPNGGVYSIAYWQDADGNPTTKDKAVAAEIVEFDSSDEQVFRNYLTLSKTENGSSN